MEDLKPAVVIPATTTAAAWPVFVQRTESDTQLRPHSAVSPSVQWPISGFKGVLSDRAYSNWVTLYVFSINTCWQDKQTRREGLCISGEMNLCAVVSWNNLHGFCWKHIAGRRFNVIPVASCPMSNNLFEQEKVSFLLRLHIKASWGTIQRMKRTSGPWHQCRLSQLWNHTQMCEMKTFLLNKLKHHMSSIHLKPLVISLIVLPLA